jgi:hypothetical protein
MSRIRPTEFAITIRLFGAFKRGVRQKCARRKNDVGLSVERSIRFDESSSLARFVSSDWRATRQRKDLPDYLIGLTKVNDIASTTLSTLPVAWQIGSRFDDPKVLFQVRLR